MIKLLGNVSLEDVKKAGAAVANLEKKIKAINEEMKNFKYSEKTSEAFCKLAEKEIELDFELKFAKENSIVIAGSYCLPIFAEIWNKYEGKQAGEKTKDKIYNEFYEATSKRFKVYTSGRDICFISMREDGYRGYDFQYRELDFYLPYGTSCTSAENKILKVDISEISQYNGIKEYKEERKAARDFIKAAKKAQKAALELNKMIAELNKMHPQKSDYIKEYNDLRYIERL